MVYMSTGATGVTPSPHHQSSTVTTTVNTQQQLPAGVCVSYTLCLISTLIDNTPFAYMYMYVCACAAH